MGLYFENKKKVLKKVLQLKNRESFELNFQIEIQYIPMHQPHSYQTCVRMMNFH